jgi:hypothetical protein
MEFTGAKRFFCRINARYLYSYFLPPNADFSIWMLAFIFAGWNHQNSFLLLAEVKQVFFAQ